MKIALRNKYTEYCTKENYNINTKVSRVKILNWICQDWYDENIITKNMIEKSFITTGISNSIEKSGEYKQIEVYKWIKEKYIVTEEEKLIDKEEYIEVEDI